VNKDGALSSGPAIYKTLVIPSSTYMPEQTVDQLVRLANAGAKIIFENKMPDRVTGYVSHLQRQELFDQKLLRLKNLVSVQTTDQLDKAMLRNGVIREELSNKGLTYIRKRNAKGEIFYFIANLSNQFQKDWLHLGSNSIMSRFDPLQGESLMRTKKDKGKVEVLLSLLPGESCFLMPAVNGAEFRIDKTNSGEFEIGGNWKLEFLEGMPSKPSAATFNELRSWTTLPDSAVFFSGKAKYSINFDVPTAVLKSNGLTIHLGDVREIASVKLNGKYIGTAWCIPYNLGIFTSVLKQKNNLLEIEVTNLSANYMRLRDQQKPDWKKFNDINIVDITYKKFDASKWEPMPSGLLGPVKLIYSE
jgi:hypothetical protein